MGIAFPLSLADFADKLGIESLTRRLGLQQEFSSQGQGTTIAADVGPALREYDVTLGLMYHADAAKVMAMIEALDGSINPFYLYDPRHLAPANDPGGAILGASSVTIHSLNANNKAMSLEGLPAGYVLGVGDMLSWDYGSSPTRRAWHRILEAVTANGSGVTAEFEVRDYIRTGSSTGLPVTLIKPAMKCAMISGSLKESTDGGMFTRIAFSVRQVI